MGRRHIRWGDDSLGRRPSLAVWRNELEYEARDRQMVRDFSLGERGVALLECSGLKSAHSRVTNL